MRIMYIMMSKGSYLTPLQRDFQFEIRLFWFCLKSEWSNIKKYKKRFKIQKNQRHVGLNVQRVFFDPTPLSPSLIDFRFEIDLSSSDPLFRVTITENTNKRGNVIIFLVIESFAIQLLYNKYRITLSQQAKLNAVLTLSFILTMNIATRIEEIKKLQSHYKHFKIECLNIEISASINKRH